MRKQLSAVLSADVVGYARLMGADQEGTYAALRTFRSARFEPAVATRGGTIIKSMGDGWLVAFDGAGDAARCALDLQEQAEADGHFRLRIGVTIGDIIHDHDDIFGDGVNLAARLQEAAPPGGIALSGAVYDSLDGVLASRFVNAGTHRLKNIARPVQLWLRSPRGSTATDTALRFVAPERPLLLTIEPVSTDDAFGPLADVPGALTTELLRLIGTSDLISPLMSAQTEERGYRLRQKLRHSGDRMRLDAALESATGETLWSAGFDGAISEIFDWQDRTSAAVAAECVGAIVDTERQRLSESSEPASTMEDRLIAAQTAFHDLSPWAVETALEHLTTATLLECRTALKILVLARLAHCHPATDALAIPMEDWLAGARASGEPDALVVLCAAVSEASNTDAQRRQTEIESALHLSPLDPDILCVAGWGFVHARGPNRAIDCFRRFETVGRMNGLAVTARCGLAVALVEAGQDALAVETARSVLEVSLDSPVALRVIASASAHLGRTAAAREALATLRFVSPGETIRLLGDGNQPTTRLLTGLRLAGMPLG